MKNSVRNSQPDNVKIEEIIDSFNNFAIRDIKVNIENPIAAFILCSCLIDQLAAFRYNHSKRKNGEYYKKFIEEYLPHYSSLKLYENLRCSLVHNYSINEYLSISTDHPFDDPNSQSKNVNIVTVHSLLHSIEMAFEKLCKELRSNTISRQKALERFAISPPLIMVNRGAWQYSEEEANYLISYYSQKIIGEFMNGEPSLRIDLIEKKKIGDSNFRVQCVTKNKGYEANLDEITLQLGLIYPIEVLKAAGLHIDA